MNKKKKQNGFTIVELVIVIAVIGILAAILIPTFSNLVKKSKESADRQLVYYINEAVIANEVDNLAKGKNGTEATMYDTLQVLEKEYGFTVEKMTPRSDSDIVWDSVTNRFALVKDGTTIEYNDANKPSNMANKAQMWRITKSTDSLEDGYSHYLTADWTGTVEVTTSVDVGENDDITSVTYAGTGSAQDVVIRTNSASTNIVLDPYVDSTDSTKGDHIEFYGSVGQVTGPKDGDGNYTGFTVAFNSIAINGKVVGLKAASGHIDLTNAVVEEDEEIIILATTTDVKVSNPNKVSTHAHATSESNANAMNDPVDSTKKSVGVIWDYDGNVAQNEIDDIHHHITEEQAAEAGESLGTGPIDGGGEWNYEEVVEEVVYVVLNKEVSESASYVARIGGQGYETLEAAFTAAVNGDTIVMLKDVSKSEGTYSNASYITIDKTVTLDLNGKEITNSSSVAFFTPSSTNITFTVTDSSSSKDGVISSTANVGIQIGSRGNIILNAGTIKGKTQGIKLGQYATATVNGGTVAGGTSSGTSYVGIFASHYDVSIVVNGGYITGSYGIYSPYTGDTVTINNGEVSGKTYGIYAKAVTVNDGNVNCYGSTSANYGIFSNGLDSNVTIHGGTISAKIYGVSKSYGSMTVDGGTILATGYNAGANDSYGIKCIGSDLTVSGTALIRNENAWTTLGKYQYGIFCCDVSDGTTITASRLTVNGGTIESADAYAVDLNGGAACTITDGTISGVVAVESWDKTVTVNISGGTFNAIGSQICYAYKGFFTISGGSFTGGETQQEEITTDKHRYNLNCKDENYVAGTAGFTVTGGTFYQFDPTHNRAEGEWTNFSIDGYHTEYNEETGYYTVVAD